MTPYALLFYVLTATAVLAWFVGVFFYFRAVRGATPGTPWRIRAQPLYLLVTPEVWPPEAHRHWRAHFACMAVFVLCIATIFLVDRLTTLSLR